MPIIGAIDIGSNAIRLAVATVGSRGSLRIEETLREPVRLGASVFRGKPISEETTIRALEGLQRFHRIMRKWGVTSFRAVGTSALREASNRHEFVNRIASATGIEIHVISGEEEARLIHRAVSHAVPLHGRLALLIDIGGGSAEISVANGTAVIAAETFALGAVRLLQVFAGRGTAPADFPKLVREYTTAARRRLAKEIGKRHVSICVGTGGNIECLRDLRQSVLRRRDAQSISRDELHAIIKALQDLSVNARMRTLNLRPDRADVILPASLVLQHLMDLVKLQRVIVPKVGLREGVLWDMIPEALGKRTAVDERQAVLSARELGERYRYDALHATTVSNLALTLFDALKGMHRLSPSDRVLLEVAALLHDVGHVINANGHHKHSAYLIGASPLIGLDEEQKNIVALIARFHRKAGPKSSHESFNLLTVRHQTTVTKLAAIVRLADALDCEHAGRVRNLRCTRKGRTMVLRIAGKGDLLLERWAVERNAQWFEEAFHMNIQVLA